MRDTERDRDTGRGAGRLFSVRGPESPRLDCGPRCTLGEDFLLLHAPSRGPSRGAVFLGHVPADSSGRDPLPVATQSPGRDGSKTQEPGALCILSFLEVVCLGHGTATESPGRLPISGFCVRFPPHWSTVTPHAGPAEGPPWEPAETSTRWNQIQVGTVSEGSWRLRKLCLRTSATYGNDKVFLCQQTAS